jgi:hypothetical protein
MTSWRHLSLLVAVGAMLVTACSGAASPTPGAASVAPSAAPPESAAPASVEPSAPPAADICTNPPKAEGKTLTFASYGGA